MINKSKNVTMHNVWLQTFKKEGVHWMIYIVLASLIASVILLVGIRLSWHYLKPEEEEKSVLEMRKAQASSNLRENQLKRKLESLIESNTKRSKKTEIEEMCLQAGYELSYGEYRLIGIVTGIIVFIAIYSGLRNLFTGLVFGFFASLLPGQLIHLIRNRRVSKLDAQVGSFMRLVLERYSSTKDFSQSIHACVKDFKGVEPMYSELVKTSADLNIGVPVSEAMRRLAKRVGNPYLQRMTDYYEIAADLGTMETRDNLLKQALKQYEENRSMKSKLRNELNGPVREAYLMTAMVPIISLYMSFSTPDYKHFMFHTGLGQFTLTMMFIVIVGVIWFINKQIGKPLD